MRTLQNSIVTNGQEKKKEIEPCSAGKFFLLSWVNLSWGLLSSFLREFIGTSTGKRTLLPSNKQLLEVINRNYQNILDTYQNNNCTPQLSPCEYRIRQDKSSQLSQQLLHLGNKIYALKLSFIVSSGTRLAGNSLTLVYCQF